MAGFGTTGNLVSRCFRARLKRTERTGCTRTHHDHEDVPQREILLRNICILASIVTLTFTGIHFNNEMYFH
jgi:hypothetical protein